MSNSSSSRSLKLKPEYKKQVKASVTRRGFASQTHLATKLGLSRDVISRFLNGKPVDRLNAEEICDKLGWDVQEVTFFQTSINKQPKTDWGEAADSPNSFEREEEFEILDQWIVKDRCPLVLIEGMAGMGKTNLSYQLAKQIANHFDYVIWRSMDQYQSLEELLDDWLSFLYEQQEIEEVKTTEEKLKQLKQKLESDRCLLILSNIHIALKDFSFIDGYQGCEKLLKLIAKKTNKSCLLITSNVTPNTVNQLERNNQLVRRIEIKSLSVKAIQNIFSSVGSFSASDEDWVKLKEIYWGNWFVLKNVAHNIQRNFDSNITNFFEFGDYVFNGIEQFIEEQLDKLSETEKEVMYWVAIYRHPISLFELRDILSGLFNDQLLNIIKYLKSRFFLESIEEGILVQPPMIREYIIKRLINNITEEIVNNNLFWLNRFPLLLTTAQSRIRKDQEKFLINPIVKKLVNQYTKSNLISHLNQLLSECQNSQSCDYARGNITNIQGNKSYGYASGNIVNLLCQLQRDFNGENFSNLVLRKINFRHHTLHNTNSSYSNLSNCIFLNGFSNVLSVAFSPDGKWLAIGDTNDKIYLWQITQNRPILRQILTSHNFWVRTLAFSPDSKIIASSGENGNIYLREVETGKLITQFFGHIDKVRDIKFSGDGKLLASSSDDQTIRLWNVERKEMITVLKHHQDKVRCVVFSPDQQTLISASQDNQICSWELNNYSLVNRFFLKENQKKIPQNSKKNQDSSPNLLRAIALSPDGKTLATGTDDGFVRLWNLATGDFKQDLGQIHHNWIRSLAFSPDGDKLASSSEDGTVRITDPKTGQLLQTLRDDAGRVWSIAFHPHRPWLVSGHDGLKVTLWNVESGEKLNSFKGYSQETRPITFSRDGIILAIANNQGKVTLQDSLKEEIKTPIETNGGNIWSLAYSPDGTILVGGGEDTKLYIWDVSCQRLLKHLSGHKNWIRGVAYSPDGKFIATGSDDKTVKLWDAHTYKCLQTFEGYTDWIRSVCFHLTEPLLASGSDDGTIRFWDITNPKKHGELKYILPTNQRQIWTIAISPDGHFLASGGNDNTVTLWDLRNLTATLPIITLQHHRGWISSVAFSPDNQWLATGSYDTTIRLYSLSSGDYQCQFILQGHGDAVISIAFHPQEPILASSSKDGTIKRWDLITGECLSTWRSPRPYEGMKITEVTGLTPAEKEDLKNLGAIE